jgi:hypothetical protein
MKPDWYYAEDGASAGPMSHDDIATRIKRAPFRPHFIWTNGMATWCDARDVPAFRALFGFKAQPHPHATAFRGQSSNAPETTKVNPARAAVLSPKVYPWRRCFARFFDVWLFALLASFATGLMWPDLFAGKSTPEYDKLLNLLYLAAFVPVEGFYLYAFGTTPRKAIYGIHLMYNRSSVGWMAAARRSLNVWVRGLGLGIPIISLITMTNAYGKLKNNNVTTWDSNLGWSVIHDDLHLTRWIGIVCAWAAIAGVVVLSMTLS